MAGKPNIFEYASFRDFLKDYYEYAKKSNPNFSYRYFTKRAGFSAPNLLYNIIIGKRSMTQKCIPPFAKVMGLNKKETRFFEALAAFNQAEDAETKRHYLEVLHGLKKEKVGALLTKEQFACISNWYYSIILELVNMPSFSEDPEWIKKELGGRVGIREIKDAIHNLLRLGLLKRNEAGGLVQSENALVTEDDVRHTAAYIFHQQMLSLAKEVLASSHSSTREIAGLTMAVSEKQFKEIKSMMRDFEDSIVRYMTGNPDVPRSVVQLNMQLFHVTGDVKEISHE